MKPEPCVFPHWRSTHALKADPREPKGNNVETEDEGLTMEAKRKRAALLT